MLAAMIHFGGVAFYACFASGELQPWAEPEPDGTEVYSKHDEARMETTALNEVRNTKSYAKIQIKVQMIFCYF